MLDDYGAGLIWKRTSKDTSIREVGRASGEAYKGSAGIGATL
jgi:hypothetical protein